MEEKIKVKTIEVRYKCTQCDLGYLKPTGTCFLSSPPLYPHKCTHCDYQETFNKTYPYIRHEEDPIS